MTRYRARKSPARLWIERLLLLAGLGAIGIWAWSVTQNAVYQDWANWAFDQRARGGLVTVGEYLRSRLCLTPSVPLKSPMPSRTPSAPPLTKNAPPPAPAIANGGVVGRLSIPRLDLHAMVREGVDEGTLGIALGHIPGTAFPGQDGNIGVAGHRDTLFRGLKGIHRNDVIRFETPAGSHEYRVESTKIVGPKDVSVLAPHKSAELTLVTCYPFYYVGSAPERFIVTAREESAPVSAAATPPVHAAGESAKAQPAAAHDEPAPAELPKDRRTSADRTKLASAPKPTEHRGEPKTVAFVIRRNHSQELMPGISMGVDKINPSSRLVNGWMWVMPDRHTIWLRQYRAHEPVIFNSRLDGKTHMMVITAVSADSVKGYLR